MTFPTDLKQRNQYILDQISAGNYTHTWHEITSTIQNHSGTFYVSASPLRVDNVVVDVSAEMQQKIADMLNASLLTAKVSDLIHQQADVIIDPIIITITDSTQAMLKCSADLDAAISKKYPNITDIQEHLVSGYAKDWVISNKIKPNVAANYGFYTNTNVFKGIAAYPTESKTKFYVIQPLSTNHNGSHYDYSQICRLMSGGCVVDGNQMTLTDVLTDPELCGLISSEGILHVLRQI